MQTIDTGCLGQRKNLLTPWLGHAAALVMTLFFTDGAQADKRDADIFYIHGALTESACLLEMSSAYQDIWLGEMAVGSLAKAGSRAAPVAFQLRLRDCTRTGASFRDSPQKDRLWRGYQPAVTVSFTALPDADNPGLVKVQGLSGLGLRLLDSDKRDVRLGDRSRLQLLALRDEALQFYVVAERTRTPLLAGTYRAAIDFRMNYD
ncbi:fimbrial protein [Serratia sp. root2]|uniref:fimbrial protein n=1 Tax=Serratia sp. root2 TaxID=3059676 RepID=UPI0028904B86|nr:fimbrial protein [Serratia sp. root2]MDT3252439.1 fimbrial protein [Serratia sp. root2]